MAKEMSGWVLVGDTWVWKGGSGAMPSPFGADGFVPGGVPTLTPLKDIQFGIIPKEKPSEDKGLWGGLSTTGWLILAGGIALILFSRRRHR